MNARAVLACLLVLAAAPAWAAAPAGGVGTVLTGKVVAVTDGDTIKILIDSAERARL